MNKVELLSLPKFLDPRGNLTFLQDNEHIPFKIKRVFWTYDVPGGETRGGHAYKEQHEVIIALSGSFDVIIELNGESKVYHLNRSYNALYIPPRTWRHMQNFSTNALSLHLSSHKYKPEDYIYNKNEVGK
jgi:dTDP-4-dehydrorhamnose 3,5-epimerase-like enzyme